MELTRLPNGYRDKVKDAKSNISEVIDILNNREICKNISQQLSKLEQYFTITGKYYDRNSMHVDFDFTYRRELSIGAYIEIGTDGKVKLGNTCAVFLHTYDNSGNENYIDAYKW